MEGPEEGGTSTLDLVTLQREVEEMEEERKEGGEGVSEKGSIHVERGREREGEKEGGRKGGRESGRERGW